MIPVIVNDVPIECLNHAAITYHVPAKLILAIMKAEGGKNGMANKNKNGSIDYGVMQVNSIWLNKIGAYGFSAKDLQYDACKNVEVGSWIISQSVANGENAWLGVGNYHSHTPIHNQAYSNTIQKNLGKINDVLG
jgi:hypothetical protein